MKTFNECKEISELDLNPIKVKLMHEESGEGWSRAQADAVEAEYRRYLYLMKFFPNEPMAPLAEVDIFWHYHILDTMKYAVDCEDIFGYFLHHFPYVGLRSDEEDHEAAAVRMSTLYEQIFGEPYGRASVSGEPAMADESRAANHVAYSVRVPKDAVSGRAGKPAYSVRVPQDAVSRSAGKAAYSVRVPQNAVSGSAGKAAYSVRVPQNAVSGSAGKAAYSVRVPQDAVSGSAGKAAYSVRVPQNAVSGSAGKAAYSVRVPQDAVSGSAGKAAYSVRVPQDAVSGSAGKAAYSVRVPQNTSFKMERPALAAA
jgi:hypothetical protein